MVQLEGTENRISVERKRYNDLVKEFNAKIKQIPTNIFASMLGFEARSYFESVSGAENAPKVDLSN
jgi:LemA protein